MPDPAISVVIVSDYAAGEEKSWDDLRCCLDGLARQDLEAPAEFLLFEWEGFRGAVPPDLAARLPALEIVFDAARTAYELKNAAVRRARAPIVAIVDADCVPTPGWLRAALLAFRRHPGAAAVSGRTLYRGRSRLERILALITRSLPIDGEASETRRIAANNVAYSRAAYLAHPLSLEAGTWGSRLQNEAILRSGGRLYFEPRMAVAHDHTGWSMEWDIRRNIGRSLVTTRQVDPRQPYAWVLRWGYAAIPIFVLGQTLLTARRCWLWHRYYSVRSYELPAAFVLALVTHVMEVPGIFEALRGRPVGATQFR